ncbi:retrovirus-related Pol polyprotein from type-1 retrotransposable element R1 [Trichonephila clavipes]|nr:retrovirus-related Pol polyprotein from type-1 retrotransposable element R1 [Trichonephila clavipes]
MQGQLFGGIRTLTGGGDILTDFLLSNNLHLCNIPGLGPTFHGPRFAVGNPDLTLTSCDLISFVENWEILSTESLSDHSFISVHFRCDLTFSDFVFKTKYGINKFIYNFRKNYNLLNSFLTNISSIELLDDFASLLINTTNASAFSTLRKCRVLNIPSFKWWNNSLRIQRNQLNAYKRRVVSLTTHGMSVDEIASMRSRYKALRANYKKSIIDTKNKAWEYFCSTNFNNFGFTFKAAFGKLSSPTNLHQISTGDPASLFHSKVSLLLDSHFPSGFSPIPLVFNDCSPPSCLSPSEVEVVFRKLRGGKAPGIDLIDYAIWKALYNSFPNLLFQFFNHCIQFNHFPSIFKNIKIKFLLKPGRDPSSTLSYRPICLLSTLGKILERIFLNRFFSVGFLRIIFSIDLSSALGKTAAALRPWTN